MLSGPGDRVGRVQTPINLAPELLTPVAGLRSIISKVRPGSR